MNKTLTFLILLVIFPFIPCTAQAQSDTSFVSSAVTDALKQYRTAIGINTHLFNGTEYYIPSFSGVKGHQFFQEKTFQNGSVKYDGAWFEEVAMLYELVQDELVIVNHSSGYSQRLVKDRVDAFRLQGHTFLRLEADSTTALYIQPGFYDLLFSGNVQVLMKRRKILFERASTDKVEREYRDASKFYIVKDNVYHLVGNKRSVMRVLQDQKRALNKFIKANKFRFSKDRENAITKIAEHYHTLHQ